MLDPLPLSLLNDYLYCTRRAALKTVEGWRRANEHTARGDIVHEHADLAGYEVVKGVTLLRALPELVASGIPVLVGASRKRFLGSLLAGADGAARPPDGRETATAVVSALAALHGAWGVRVHDVRASVDAVKVVEAWTRAGAIGSDG